jgi:integrase/recombinase XerD
MSSFPCLVRWVSPSGDLRHSLGDPFVDRYLEFVAGRCRPNTLTATAFDLKTFFTVVDRARLAVTPADVFEFFAAQRGDRGGADERSGVGPVGAHDRSAVVDGVGLLLVSRRSG